MPTLRQLANCPASSPACTHSALRKSNPFEPATFAQLRYNEAMRGDRMGDSAGSQIKLRWNGFRNIATSATRQVPLI